MADQSFAQPSGQAHVNDAGGVDTGGHRAWVWCEDSVTGHRFDVLATSLPLDGLTVVEGYPLHFKTAARPGKSRTAWESDPAEPTEAAPAPTTTAIVPAAAAATTAAAKTSKGGQA